MRVAKTGNLPGFFFSECPHPLIPLHLIGFAFFQHAIKFFFVSLLFLASLVPVGVSASLSVFHQFEQHDLSFSASLLIHLFTMFPESFFFFWLILLLPVVQLRRFPPSWPISSSALTISKQVKQPTLMWLGCFLCVLLSTVWSLINMTSTFLQISFSPFSTLYLHSRLFTSILQRITDVFHPLSLHSPPASKVRLLSSVYDCLHMDIIFISFSCYLFKLV